MLGVQYPIVNSDNVVGDYLIFSKGRILTLG